MKRGKELSMLIDIRIYMDVVLFFCLLHSLCFVILVT